MAPSKKHHYVPQFLLRRFATEEKQIITVQLPEGRCFTSSVLDTGSENKFYTLSQNNPNPEALEEALGELENSAAPVLRCIESGDWPLSLDDRIILGAFVTLQALRGPDKRRLMRTLRAEMVERETQRVEEHGASKWFADRGLHLTEERACNAWDSVIGTGEPLVTIDADYHLEQIATHAETVLPHLLARSWTLVRFKVPTLIISDVPVSLNDVQDGACGNWGLLNAPSISLPLNRTTALVFGTTYPSKSEKEVKKLLEGTFDQEVVGNEAWASWLNARTVHNAYRALFHHPDDGALIPSEFPLRGNRVRGAY